MSRAPGSYAGLTVKQAELLSGDLGATIFENVQLAGAPIAYNARGCDWLFFGLRPQVALVPLHGCRGRL